MQRDKATDKIGFRIPSALKQQIEERAAEEGRTVSNLVVNVMTDYLKKIDDAKRLLNGK